MSAVQICRNAWATASTTFLRGNQCSALVSMVPVTSRLILAAGMLSYRVIAIISVVAPLNCLTICFPYVTKPKATRATPMRPTLIDL